MANRNTAVVAVAVLAMAMYQLSRLIRPTEIGTPWQIAVLAGLALGFVLTWAGLVYRLPIIVVGVINGVALLYLGVRVGAPQAMNGLIPQSTALDVLNIELSQATAIIRNGIEPVVPVPGLVVILMTVLWASGALAAFGVARGRPWLAVAPGLVLGAQFTTMARTPTTVTEIAIYVALIALAVLAVTSDQRRATPGRMAHSGGSVAVRRGVAPAMIAALILTVSGAVVAAGSFRTAVPAQGVMAWRATTGLSDSVFGGVSYNPFISIRSSLVSDSETPVFIARISGDVAPHDLSFRLLTMEEYNAGQFAAGGTRAEDPGNEWENPGHRFAGPTASTTSTVVIDRLRMEWLPALYAPTAVRGDGSLDSALRVREADAALFLEGAVSYSGMEYVVESDVPVPDMDVLARQDDGTLSPLFAAAVADGTAALDPAPREVAERGAPPEGDRYLELPVGLDAGIATIARQQTSDLTTEFEQGLALESWLRSDEFRYTTSIPPGHGAQELAEWLLPRYSNEPFYRSGYCENFATAMAVMARTLGIHSRVVLGFTPGERVEGDPGMVVVRDKNAHAWVELWIPSQGWVSFDPTPRTDGAAPATSERIASADGFNPMSYRDQLNDTTDPVVPPTPPEFQEFDEPSSQTEGGDASAAPEPWTMPDWMRRVPPVLAVALVVFGAIPMVKWWQRRSRLRRLRNGDVTAAWDEIVSRLTDLGRTPPPGMTPEELAESVAPQLQPLASVYGRALYGPEGAVRPDHVVTAERSMVRTEAHLVEPLTRWQRLVAVYRLGSVLPARWRSRR